MYVNHQVVWVLEGSQWIKQCDVPIEVRKYGVCFCAVADGFITMGGDTDNGTNSFVCYHYSLSDKRWRRLSDMITSKKNAEAVEISPMVVMVLGGDNGKDRFSTECEIFNVMENEWSSVRPLPGYLERIRVAATGGRVFIMGQYGDIKAPAYELLEYNASTDIYIK